MHLPCAELKIRISSFFSFKTFFYFLFAIGAGVRVVGNINIFTGTCKNISYLVKAYKIKFNGFFETTTCVFLAGWSILIFLQQAEAVVVGDVSRFFWR